MYCYVSEFWKTDQIVTLGLFYFIAPANSYTLAHTLVTHAQHRYHAGLAM